MVIFTPREKFLLSVFLFAAILLFGRPDLYPQTNSSNSGISGQVLDHQKLPLPLVQVYIEELQRGDVTNSDGKFYIRTLPPGNYDLTFKLQGFQTVKKRGILFRSNAVEVSVEMTPAVIEFDHVVITATRESAKTYEVPQMVSSISAQKIREKAIQQTSEVLRATVGVTVQKTNVGGGSPIIRGLKANKLLFLVDGIRLNNATYRGGNIQYLNTIDAGALDRLEVVHGPISVLHGSDALGGVVNAITQKPILGFGGSFAFKGALSASLSTADNTKSTLFNLTASNSKWGVLLNASFNSFGNMTRGNNGGETLMHRLQNDARTRRVLNKVQSPNAYDAYNLSSKILWKPSYFQEFTFAYQLNRQNEVPRYDVIEAQKDSIRIFDPQERDLIYLRYFRNSGNLFFNSVTATLSFHRQFERRIRQKFGNATRTSDQFRTWTSGLQLQFNKLMSTNHHLVYGAEVYYDDVATHSTELNTTTGATSLRAPLFPDGSSFVNFGAFAQDAFRIAPKWNLTLGARFSAARLRAPFADDPNSLPEIGNLLQTSTAFTGSIGSQFNLDENISLVSNLAQGFRAPNLDDVSKLGPGKGSSFFDVPNPNAKPEKSVSYDAGVKIHSDRVQANLFGFYNYLTDLLLRRPTEFNGSPVIIDGGDTLAVFHKENAGRAYTTGIAMDANIRLSSSFKLFGNASYTYGKNISDNDPLSGIPPFNGLLGIRLTHSRYWLELNTRFSREQTRLSLEDQADLRIPEGGTPGWQSFNFRSGWNFSKLEFNFAILNILDQNYREHLSGFNAAGRNFILTARWSLNE